MKVKIFSKYSEDALCNSINKWIEENSINVINMKYSTVAYEDGNCYYSVLVMWSEK